MNHSKSNQLRSYRLNLRLNESEYQKLSEEAKNLSQSKSDFIRDIIKHRKPIEVLMTQKQCKKFISEFNRIGNNINQLAKKANAGEIILDESFSSIQEELHLIYNYIVRSHGLHKNSKR